jgi:hypothetical protein
MKWFNQVYGTAGTADGLSLIRRQGVAYAVNHNNLNYIDEMRALLASTGRSQVHFTFPLLQLKLNCVLLSLLS